MAKFFKSNPNFSWQQTMLRIKDPKVTVPFYEKHFGLRLIHNYDFPQWNFSLYFLGHFTEEETKTLPPPGTKESEAYLWSMKGTCLELTHNHGTESDPTFKVNNGNVEPHRGFGHIAMMTKDVYAASEELEANGVQFQKRPNEGKMKGLAFALDPDGYWIEIIKRRETCTFTNKFTFAQTMLRVKDAKKSLYFYRDLLGMTLLNEIHLGVGESWGFSLYFLAHVPEELKKYLATESMSPEERKECNAKFIGEKLFGPVLELTHNHGTEDQADFKYHNGNANDNGELRGFGHTGFLCDNLQDTCDSLIEANVPFQKKPTDGNMKSLAFALDPDGYWVELIDRNYKSFME